MSFFHKCSSILVFMLYFTTVNSRCRQSYTTICDNFEDFKNYNDTENVSDMIIGSEDGQTTMTTINLVKTLQLNKFHKLTTLTILRTINKLENTDKSYVCTYRELALRDLILYGNTIKTIGSRNFPYVEPLERLILANNQIETVEKFAFVNHDIEHLDLSDNFLEVIVRSALPLHRMINVINLSNNQISHIEPESLNPRLKKLHLDRNRLRYFQSGVLEPLTKLEELTLSHNYLNNLPEIKHMKQLAMFDISYNSITTVENDTFKDMENLRFLDLSNNRISNPSILKWVYTAQRLPHLTLSLAFNRLKDLDTEGVDFQNRVLVLYGNPWDCEKWHQLKAKLEDHQSQCDKKFSTSDEVPYCINYNTDDIDPLLKTTDMFNPYIDRLHSSIKKNARIGGCALEEKKNLVLFQRFWVCVG